MPMKITLDLPEKLPRWATDAGSTVEPEETDKDTGGEVGTRPPARWYNWLLNTIYQWTQEIAGSVVSTLHYHSGTYAGTTAHNMIYHPVVGEWVMFTGAGAANPVEYSSYNGVDWTVGTGIGANQYLTGNGGIDTTRYIVCGHTTDGGGIPLLYYATSTGSWASRGPFGAATGYATAFCTKYPDGDFIVAADDEMSIRFASDVTVANGSWTTPTTPPPTPTGTYTAALLRTGSISWFLVSDDGYCSISTDDAVNWSLATAITAIDNITVAGYDEDLGRIVVFGYQDTVYTHVAVYSDDQGSTWNTITLSNHDYPVTGSSNLPSSIYYAGGGAWSVGCDTGTYYTSKDSGETFAQITHEDGGKELTTIACDGSKLCIGSDSVIYSSNVVARG